MKAAIHIRRSAPADGFLRYVLGHISHCGVRLLARGVVEPSYEWVSNQSINRMAVCLAVDDSGFWER